MKPRLPAHFAKVAPWPIFASGHSDLRARASEIEQATFNAAQYPLLRLSAVGDNVAMEAEPHKADRPKRKRRWFQFSLRTLLVFTAVEDLRRSCRRFWTSV
jgi:hypothetical protein